MEKKLLLILACSVLIFAACGKSGDDEAEFDANKVITEMETEGIKVSLLDVQLSDKANDKEAIENHVFVKMLIKVENNSDKSLTLDHLQDTTGNVDGNLGALMNNYKDKNYPQLEFKELKSGESYTGTITYEVPKEFKYLSTIIITHSENGEEQFVLFYKK